MKKLISKQINQHGTINLYLDDMKEDEKLSEAWSVIEADVANELSMPTVAPQRIRRKVFYINDESSHIGNIVIETVGDKVSTTSRIEVDNYSTLLEEFLDAEDKGELATSLVAMVDFINNSAIWLYQNIYSKFEDCDRHKYMTRSMREKLEELNQLPQLDIKES